MGRAIILLGVFMWVAAVIAVVRDRRARRFTRIAAIVLLVAAALGAVVLWVR